MNNYQIYEEIGRGRHSTVYKGRRKRSIEYYAIASIEKSLRQRVLNSVHFLRGLDHPHVLRFHNWYETNNHLWVITEYCTGGNLKSLLELETALPEQSTRTFSRDLVEGLHFLHSKGVLYGDVKPSNVLMDDCALLRFYDFGLALSVDAAENHSRVGTPAYMAPELFDGGVHSYASDLWALGCTLFEMATGKPPFVHSELRQLIAMIVQSPTPRVENYGAEFNDLIDGLLQKDPLLRYTWDDVANSDFFTTKLEQLRLPEQPAFEKYRAQRIAQRNARPTSRETEGRQKDALLRASVNAEKNLARELQNRGGYGAQTATDLGVDREVDFTDPPPEEEGDRPASATAQPASPAAGPPEPLTVELTSELRGPVIPVQASAPTADTRLTSARASTTSLPPTPATPVRSSMAASRTQVPVAPPPAATPALAQLWAHPSDSQARPVMMNSRIEKIGEPIFEPKDLAFPAKTVAQLKQMDGKELEAFVGSLYSSLGGTTSLADKHNTLSYFCTLCSDTQLANAFVNSSLTGLCVKILALEKMPVNVCALIATLLGLLMRYATIILADLQQRTGIFAVLTASMQRSKPAKLRRRALGCAGELLFFIASQSPDVREQWFVPAELTDAVAGAVEDPDDVARHYAVKSIENTVTATTLEAARETTSMARRFSTAPVVEALLRTFAAPVAEVRSEQLRAAALHTALRACTVDEALGVAVLRQLQPAVLGDVLAAHSAKAAQALLSFVNFLMARRIASMLADPAVPQDHIVRQARWRETTADAAQESVFFDAPTAATPFTPLVGPFVADIVASPDRFLNGIACCLEHASSAVRGKAVLAVSLLSAAEPAFLVRACDYKLLAYLERVGRDRDPYVQAALGQWYRLARQIADATFRSVAAVVPATAPAITAQLRLVLQLLGSRTLLAAVLTNATSVIASLGAGIQRFATVGESCPEFRSNLLRVAEAVAQDPTAVTTHHEAVVNSLLEPLVAALRNTDAGVRFQAMKLLHDMLATLMSNTAVYNPARASSSRPVQRLNALAGALVPELAALLRDANPMPLYALKVVSLLCDRGADFVSQLAQPTIVDTLLEFFAPGHANSTAFTAKVLLRALQSGGDSLVTHAISRGLVEQVTETLSLLLTQPDELRRPDTIGDPCVELMLTVLFTAKRDPHGPAASKCSVWAEAVDTLILPLCAARVACSECAAACVPIVVAKYPVHHTLLSPVALGQLRACFTDVDDFAVHIAAPLAEALTTALTLQDAGVAAAAALRSDELLLILLQDAVNGKGGDADSDLPEAVQECLAALAEHPA